MHERKMPVLPVDAYTSRDWFDREQRLIFSNTWALAGLMEDVAEPGAYVSVQAGLNNIFVIKGRDHRLRAFHNMCRHRGTQLLRAVGKSQKAITCPYHDWTYDLEGNLISVPEEDRQFKDLDKSCLGLKPCAVDVWRGMIFVHPNPEVGSLMDWFGGLDKHMAPYDPAELYEFPEGRLTKRIKANWKIVAENFMDGYHLSHLHSGTLAMYDHSRIECGHVGPHFMFWEPLAPHYLKNIKTNAPYPLIDQSPPDKLGAYVPMLFPGIGLAESESMWSTFHIQPVAPDETIVDIRSKFAAVSTSAFEKQARRSESFWKSEIKAKYDGDAKSDPLATGDFMEEDVFVCEQQQKSLTSPYFEHGATSEIGEKPVRDHQQVVLDYMEGRR